jgi:hypothetical protein
MPNGQMGTQDGIDPYFAAEELKLLVPEPNSFVERQAVPQDGLGLRNGDGEKRTASLR